MNRAERRGDYWNFGGIFRPVYLEARPARFIDRLAIDARADGSFRAEVFLGGEATAGRSLRAEIRDRSGPVGAPLVLPLAAGATKATVAGLVPGARSWTAETPHLYRVRIALLDRDEVQHEVSERFGFRTFEVRAGEGLYLNGRRIVLKGVNRHSFSSDERAHSRPER